MASYNSILLNFQLQKSEINEKFYNNICRTLFKRKELLMKAIDLFYEPKKHENIKNSYDIKSNNNISFLFAYRFCLNVIYNKNERGIYYPLYESDKIDYLKTKFYPGNDAKANLVYSEILNHFKTKPEEGYYVCLCRDWHYHSVPSGFPTEGVINVACPKCKKNIGTVKNNKIVKREGYYRILKDEKEIDLLKKK